MKIHYNQMKTLFVVFISIATMAHAQFTEHHFMYVSGALTGGNYFGGSLMINYVYNDQYSFQIRSSHFIRSSKSKPSDYISGVFSLLSLETLPYDQVTSYGFLVGKVKNLNEKGTIRFNLRGGVSYSFFKEPFNWQKVGNGFLSPNYTFDYRTQKVVSLDINPEIEFPITRFFGLSTSPFVELNTKTIVWGIEIKTLWGILRKSNKHKTHKQPNLDEVSFLPLAVNMQVMPL